MLNEKRHMAWGWSIKSGNRILPSQNSKAPTGSKQEQQVNSQDED